MKTFISSQSAKEGDVALNKKFGLDDKHNYLSHL